MQAPLKEFELQRLRALRDYQILDTPPEAEFDDFTHLAAHICDTPIALISLIDADRQWFKSKVGLDLDGTPREYAFCDHTIRQNGVFLVADTEADPRFADTSLVTGDSHVRFYAGAPLLTEEGYALGTLCVADHVPRSLTSEQKWALQALSRQIITQMDLRRQIVEREKVEKERRISEARKAAIFNSALDCIITFDQHGCVVEWNPAAEWTFGHLADEAIGKEMATLIVPASLREAHYRNMARMCRTGEVHIIGEGPVLGKRIELTAMRAGGDEFPVEMAVTPVALEGQTIFTAYLRDITERKQNEEALKQSQAELEARVAARTAELSAANRSLASEIAERQRVEDNYRSLFENAVEGIFQSSPDGHYLSANPALARMYGFESPNEMLRGLADIGTQLYVQPTRRTDFARLMQESDTLTNFEAEVYCQDGTTLWISESARAIRAADGTLLRYEGTVEDITARRQAEEALRVSEARYQRIVANVPGMVFQCIIHANGAMDFPFVSNGCRTIYGLEPAEITESPALIVDIICPEDLPAFIDAVTHTVADLIPWKWEGRIVTRDGQTKWVNGVARPERQPNGDILCEGLLRDVSEHRAAEEEIRALHAELIQAYDATIEGWSRALDLRDHETEGHCRRVTDLTLRVAEEIGIPKSEMIHLRRGALLHDIGKMGVPDRVLLKPGPLDEVEWAIMRRHPELACEMLGPISFLRPALAIPGGHHEKWDGTGYPGGLKGEEIPLAARLFAVVDVWDALRSDRPYREAWPAERVLDHIRSLSGSHFDPQIVQVFLAIQQREMERENRREVLRPTSSRELSLAA